MAKHPKGITVVATTAEEPFTVATIPVNSWSFAIRVWLATILALFVSFWLQLESPTTAALTVGILAEPTRGQALDKAGFRLLATVVGVTASIAISGLFAQARVLILAAFAVWIGICVFAAKLLDGYRAYAAVLSGYTVALIATQQIDTPQHVFESGMARGAAIRFDRNCHDPGWQGQPEPNALAKSSRRTRDELLRIDRRSSARLGCIPSPSQ